MPHEASPARLIDARIATLADWRGPTLAHLRAPIHEALPRVVEGWKWGLPVWSHHGILCTGETYKAAVKITFARGAALPDPTDLFNASLTGNTRRAIDVGEGARLGEEAFRTLMRADADLNPAEDPSERRRTG